MPYAYQTPIIVGSAPEVTRWKAMEAPSLVNALTAEYNAREKLAEQERNYWDQQRQIQDQAEQRRYNRATAAAAAAEDARRWGIDQSFQREKMANENQMNQRLLDQDSRSKEMSWFAANQAKQDKAAADANALAYANIFSNIGKLYKQPEDIPIAEFKLLTPSQQQNVANAFKRIWEQEKTSANRSALLADAIPLLGPNPTKAQIDALQSQIDAGLITPEKVTAQKMAMLKRKQAATPDLPVPNPYWEAGKFVNPLPSLWEAPLANYLEKKMRRDRSPETEILTPIPLPNDRSKWIPGQPYMTAKGIGLWDGTKFIQE